ncbi:hypothetical protein [Xanthomonas arboricola]|uniref:hypothetical protein n=1 Tax=Xanthomonas arboricola TaxID=56448 RepID=UPI002E13D2EC
MRLWPTLCLLLQLALSLASSGALRGLAASWLPVPVPVPVPVLLMQFQWGRGLAAARPD